MLFIKKAVQLFVFVFMSAPFLTQAMAGQNVDAGLYDPVAPAGSAFIRFYSSNDMETITAKGKTFPNLKAYDVSSYYVVKAGEKVKITAGKGTIESPLTAGSFYTVLAGNTPLVLQDGNNADKTKCLINLYNLTGEDGLSLVTADKNIAVIDSVKTNATGSRAINPLKLAFAVTQNGKQVKVLDEKVLERGQSYSVFAVKKDGATDLIWVQSTTNTRQ